MRLFLKEILGRGDKNASSEHATSSHTMASRHPPSRPSQAVELGTIDYVNLTPDQRHGDYDAAVQAAVDTGKPIFANFVEWSG